VIFEAAHALGIVPLLWLLWLKFRLEHRDAALWWLAAAFAVSFLADSLAHLLNVNVAINTYPLMQAALIGLVLLDRAEALKLFGVLTAVALAVPVIQRPDEIEHFLSTVASLSVAGIAFRYRSLPARLRLSLLVTFGLGWVAWDLWYAFAPGWGSWLGYQGTRLVGTLLFCWAALRPGPSLGVAR